MSDLALVLWAAFFGALGGMLGWAIKVHLEANDE